MTRRNLLFSLFITFLILSCSSDSMQNKGAAVDTNVTPVVKEVIGTLANQSMAIAIEGMSCEMACVSSVKKTLSTVNGISNLEIHFDADNKIDTAFVDYDESMVNADQLIDAIQTCNGGLYKVKAVEITKTVAEGANNAHGSSSSKADKAEKTKYRKFNFPSLLDLIKTVGL